MKDRLIQLLKKADEYAQKKCITDYDEAISANADFLLSEGVIAPPFPIGTTYYRIVKKEGKHIGEFYHIREYKLNYYNIEKVLNDFGKSVFLSREDAEKAIKGGGSREHS